MSMGGGLGGASFEIGADLSQFEKSLFDAQKVADGTLRVMGAKFDIMAAKIEIAMEKMASAIAAGAPAAVKETIPAITKAVETTEKVVDSGSKRVTKSLAIKAPPIDFKPIQDSIRSGLDRVEGMLTSFKSRIIGFFAGLGIASGANQILSWADDLAKSTKYAGLVFGESSEGITAASERMSTRFGVSRRDIIQGITEIGDVFRRIGAGPGISAGMSTELAKTAIAVGKMRDVDAETALKLIEYGLEGSTRGLKALGINLREEQVEMEASRLGFIKWGDSFSETDLTIARSSVIMRTLGAASRAMAGEQPSLSTKMASAWASIKHAFEDVGTAFLPIAHRLIDGVRWVADSISAWVSRHKADMDYFVSSVQWALDRVIVIAKDWRDRFMVYLSEKGINTESLVSAFRGISARIRGFFEDLEDYAAILVIKIQTTMANIQEIFVWSSKVVSTFVQNFKRDWSNNVIDTIGIGIDMLSIFYGKIQEQSARAGDIIGAWMSGGKQLPWSQPVMPPKPPPIEGPGRLVLSDFDKEIKDIVDRLKARQEGREKPVVGPLKPPEEGGPEKGGPRAPRKAAIEYPTPLRRPGQAEFMGLADFAKKIQTTALSQQIDYSRQTAAFTERSAVALELIAKQKPLNGGAKAVGPE